MNNVPSGEKIKPGLSVSIIQKHVQRTGNLATGNAKRILTSSEFRPYGIKVEFDSGKIGRVQNII